MVRHGCLTGSCEPGVPVERERARAIPQGRPPAPLQRRWAFVQRGSRDAGSLLAASVAGSPAWVCEAGWLFPAAGLGRWRMRVAQGA